MKRIGLLLILTFIFYHVPNYCKAQSNADTSTVLSVDIYKISGGKSLESKILLTSVNTGTDAVLGYKLKKNTVLSIIVKKGSSLSYKKRSDSTMILTIIKNTSGLNKDSTLKDTITFKSSLNITANKDADIIISTYKDNNANKPDTGSFTFLNAYNFNFSTPLTSNYVGHVNIMKVYPLSNDGGFIKAVGFNVGIMKISYSGGDLDSTSNSVYENVLIHPLDNIQAGTKYLQEYNRYTSSYQNTAWSFYAQPLFLVNKDPDNQIFLHLHFELLANNWTATIKVTNVQTDTAVITNTNGFKASQDIGNTIVYKTNLLNGYFGFGATFNLKINSTSKIFLQPTVGYTTNTPNFASVDINSRVTFVKQSGGSAFYLARVNYEKTVTKSLTIDLGTDIRGLFPSYPPMYAAYVGAKLDINAIAKLLNP